MMLSIVIATRDREAMLSGALASLAAQRDAPAYEVVIVDNGSSDGTAELVRDRAAVSSYPLLYVYVGEPNRGAARNAGVRAASGDVVLFVDDDVRLPERFLFAHASAHAARGGRAISGPILNVSDAASQPTPTLRNYTAAFFCTCNVSIARAAFDDVGGFDETFTLYGWEDTELGLRLRESGVARGFAWDAYLWHIKPPHVETLESVVQKTVERGRMAGRLLHKNGSMRAKLATGAYGFNLVRSTLLAPAWSLDRFHALATNERAPAALRALARGQFLDGRYRIALREALASERGGSAAHDA